MTKEISLRPVCFHAKMRENALSPRKVFFATYTPNGSPLGGRRREKWMEHFAACGPRTLRGVFDSLE